MAGTGEADLSIPGIVLATLSLLVMPFLSATPAKGRTGTHLCLGSRGLQADPAVHLPLRGAAGRPGPQRRSGIVVADPIAALVIAAIAVKEGRDAWQGKG